VFDSIVISHNSAKSAEVIVMSITDLFDPGGSSVGLPSFIMQAPFTSTIPKNALSGRSDLEHQEMCIKVTCYERVLVFIKSCENLSNHS